MLATVWLMCQRAVLPFVFAHGPRRRRGIHIKVYGGVSWLRMGRTNVVVDDDLVERVMKLYRLPSKRAAIDFALRAVAGSKDPRGMLRLQGIGWEGDLDLMRRSEVPDLDPR